ncbi:hypothetical protein ACIBFB_26300 [Nocardiopsis sp. NPDC050513]|uniref:hypothetical protein n=1 Tax=Nocardiopsis sp. NPDC050513 TaxID=3364338 RepID=UPI00379B6F2D
MERSLSAESAVPRQWGGGGPKGLGYAVARDPGGRTDIPPRVVERVAAQAVREVPEADPARSRVVRAWMSGDTVRLRLRIAVRYRRSVTGVADRVRSHVRKRVEWATGGRVHHVDIEIAELVR